VGIPAQRWDAHKNCEQNENAQHSNDVQFYMDDYAIHIKWRRKKIRVVDLFVQFFNKIMQINHAIHNINKINN
jgi:hypothetical protein